MVELPQFLPLGLPDLFDNSHAQYGRYPENIKNLVVDL